MALTNDLIEKAKHYKVPTVKIKNVPQEEAELIIAHMMGGLSVEQIAYGTSKAVHNAHAYVARIAYNLVMKAIADKKIDPNIFLEF